jgi:hypothetical protein
MNFSASWSCREVDAAVICPAVALLGASLENDRIRVKEIGVIENIEGLHPELHIHSLGDAKLLEHRSVDVNQARAR